MSYERITQSSGIISVVAASPCGSAKAVRSADELIARLDRRRTILGLDLGQLYRHRDQRVLIALARLLRRSASSRESTVPSLRRPASTLVRRALRESGDELWTPLLDAASWLAVPRHELVSMALSREVEARLREVKRRASRDDSRALMRQLIRSDRWDLWAVVLERSRHIELSDVERMVALDRDPQATGRGSTRYLWHLSANPRLSPPVRHRLAELLADALSNPHPSEREKAHHFSGALSCMLERWPDLLTAQEQQ